MSASISLRRLTTATAIALGVAGLAPAATLVPNVNFGGGDGWRAPFEVLAGDSAGSDSISPGLYNYLGNAVNNTGVNAGNLERGMAYNPTTGHLILVSRNDVGGTLPSVRILDATTGVDVGSLNLGSGVVAGGLFTKNMIGVGDDGAIYMANLTTAAPANGDYKVYRWANETSTPTVAFTGAPLPGARMGDSFDVIGSGANTRLVAGYNSGPAVAGNNGFALFSTTDGLTFTGTHVALAATPPVPLPAAGEFRLGITFQDSDTILGKSEANPVSVVDVTGAAGNVVANFSTDGIPLRPMDFAVVDGKPILAVVEASPAQDALARARIFVYDMTDPSLPLAERKIGEASALTDPGPGVTPKQFANGNSVGQVKFGAINDNVATIYAMSTNNGIQAFTLTLDLPAADDANFNGDDAVDGADFLIWQAGFGALGTGALATGDANDDTNVDDADFVAWKSQFGDTGLATPAATGVPEPAAGFLTIMAIAALAARRRRS